MAGKTDKITELYQSALKEITSDSEKWTSFLKSACQNFRLPFDEQLLVYVQRPKAKAVLEIGDWNKRFGRTVKKYSTGIAVLDKKSAYPKVKYYFDISDTQESRNAYIYPAVPLWEVEEQHYDDVKEAVINAFGISESSGELDRVILTASKNMAEDHLTDYFHDIFLSRKNSFLEELDEFNVKALVSSLLSNSLAYMLLERCSFDADGYFEREDFQKVTEFNTPELMNIFGTAVSDISETALSVVAETVKNFENRTFAQNNSKIYNEKADNKADERSFNNGEAELQGTRRVLSSRSGGKASAGGLWEVRISASAVSNETKVRSVSELSDNGNTQQSPERDTETGGGDDGNNRSANDGVTRRDRGTESSESIRVDKENEQYQPVSRRNDIKRPDILINGKSGSNKLPDFDFSLNEQLSLFDYSYENDGSYIETEYSLPDEVISSVLRSGTNDKDGIYHIAAEFMRKKSPQEITLFLKKEYGTGGKGLVIDNTKYAVWFDKNGVRTALGNSVYKARDSVLLSWEDVYKRINDLLEVGHYMPQNQLDRVIGIQRKEAAEYLWYLERESANFPIDAELFKGGFPDSTERIAKELENLEAVKDFIAKLEKFNEEYKNDPSLINFKYYSPEKSIGDLKNLLIQPKEYKADEKFTDNTKRFMSEDEIDNYFITRGSGVSGGKYRIYQYFSENHDSKEVDNFFKKEFGIGGYCNGNFNESHDAKGISFSIGDITNPDDKVTLKWKGVIKRIRSLISEKRYMTQKEIDYLPDYEKNKLAVQIRAFFYDVPEEEYRPYSKDMDYSDSIKSIRLLLESPEKTETLLNNMSLILDSTDNTNRLYESMKLAVQNLTDYKNGNYSLFPETKTKAADNVSIPKKIKSTAQRNYSFLEKTAPEILSGECRYIRFTSEGFMPLSIQALSDDRISISHFYRQNGDLMSDPDMEFVVDRENKLLSARTYRQDGLGVNQGVENEYQEIADFRLEKELNAFTLEWFKNISNQGYSRNKMIIDYRDFNMTVNYAENNQIVSFTGWDNTSAVPLSEWRKAVKEIEKRYKSPYDIMFSHMGNGVTVCNKLREKYGDYENIAHISTEREVTFYDDKMPEEVRKYIEDFAKYKDMQISASQPESVFSVPAYEKEQHQPEKQDGVSEQIKPVYKNETLSAGKNYRITDMNPSYGGAKHRFQSNIEAIRILKQCEEENRQALPEEQEILAKYVGWGGLSNAFDSENEEWKNEYAQLKEILTPDEYSSAQETVLTSFYTPPAVIQSVYKVIDNTGLKEGNILDPGCGIGNFQGLIPESMKNVKMYGIEQDSVSGRIAKLLYPENQIDITSYENTDLPDNFFDISVGNIPFGSYQIADKKYDRLGLYVYDYFIVKTLDKLRPGGIMAVITTKGTMDKKSSDVRKYIAQRAELLGAIRLPDNTFSKNAGTRITSDILFLQKRERVIDIEPDWIHLNEDENGLAVNSYFAEHPEMILGKMVIESSPYGMQSACKQIDGTNLEEMLSEAVNKISADIPDYEHQRDEEVESIPADPSVRNFSFTEVNGKLYYRENSRMIRLHPSDTAASRISGMIKIRDCVRNLLEMQADDYPIEDIKKEQSKLNYLYDSFTQKYGILNSRANNLAFRSDSSYGLLCSLEILDDEKQFSRKADIFTKRTVKPKVTVNAVDNAYEALALSLNEKGLIDIGYMNSLYGKGMEKLTEDLKGKIYQNPLTAHDELTGWETAEEYLSGNVRRKFEAAQKAAETDKKYEENVKALERVLPKDLGPGDIKVQLGTTWIPSGIIDQFVYELLNPSANFRDKINVKFMESNGEWYVSNKNIDKGNVNAISKYGTKRLNAYWIIESSLNLRTVRVWDKKYDSVTGKESRVLNQKETALAQNKQEIIQQKFEAWIWQDADRRKKLCRIYNDRFNCLKPREYDGSLLTFPEMNPEISLNSHQKNAVARIVFGGNSLIAHAVGGGKTFTMCAACMRLKQLKIASKPMITVLDNTLYDFAAAFMSLYPNANILLATEQDFEKRNRRKFFARIATGEYDAVILTHTQFGKIPISYARQERLIKENIQEITDGISRLKSDKGERITIKQLERTKKSLESKLKKLSDQSKKDDIISFEELGVDCLFVDEADMFKNLYLHTKMGNVSGLAQTESQKASDLFLKTRYLDEITGGNGVILATGTPISNSIVEIYTMQRYIQYGLLKEMKLDYFDAWASNFCVKTSKMELKPEGSGFQMKTRLAYYKNVPELINMFKCAADIQTEDMLDLPKPKAVYKKVVTPPTEVQIEMLNKIAERAEKIRKGNVDPRDDNMLVITNDGRKLALDQRVINPKLPDDPDSKVNACVKNILDIWEKTKDKRLTQLVFCDMSTPDGKYDPIEMVEKDGVFVVKERKQWNVYQDIADKLISAGVPANEIAFIHEAKNNKQKDAIFAKVRTGKIRILFGSTMKMGAGTNVQKYLVALHDLDIPMRPRDLEQRHGRMVRFGNLNKEVYIFRYITERTFDAYMYQMLENKQRITAQIMTSKAPSRVIEDADTEVLSYAECKAIATGDPRIMEYCTLQTEINMLNLLKNDYLNQKYELEDKVLKYYPSQISSLEQRVSAYQKDVEHIKNSRNAGCELKGILYADKMDAGKALMGVIKTVNSESHVLVGSYCGFSLSLSFDAFSDTCYAHLSHSQGYKVTMGEDIRGNITRLDNFLGGLPDKLENCRNQLQDAKRQLETAAAEANKPFEKEEELKNKMTRFQQLKVDLKIDERKYKDFDSKDKSDRSYDER